MAVIRTGTPDSGHSAESFVVSVGANLEGELRRLVIALPIVVSMLRVVHRPAPDPAVKPLPRR
jgi:hypothetical protein